MKIIHTIIFVLVLIGGFAAPVYAVSLGAVDADDIDLKIDPIIDSGDGGVSPSAASFSAPAPINYILMTILLISISNCFLRPTRSDTPKTRFPQS